MTNSIYLTLAGGNEVWINLENVAYVRFHVQKEGGGDIKALVHLIGTEAPLPLAGQQAEQIRNLVRRKAEATQS